ncbi:hypothetical protein ANCCAN_02111 [Ancylostoma caninum]|uniref:Uncharacterized protein n=1 Tax=Ancylostoma caninum TaxID=29170 RepID=A0A368H570_ANCCA|nr:hypothetical protein ANCCAN_02111 [Ancylostoma caninum]
MHHRIRAIPHFTIADFLEYYDGRAMSIRPALDPRLVLPSRQRPDGEEVSITENLARLRSKVSLRRRAYSSRCLLTSFTSHILAYCQQAHKFPALS